MKRRGFIGALLAVIAAPKSLFESAQPLSVVGPIETTTTFAMRTPDLFVEALTRAYSREGFFAPYERHVSKFYSGADAVHPARALNLPQKRKRG